MRGKNLDKYGVVGDWWNNTVNSVGDWWKNSIDSVHKWWDDTVSSANRWWDDTASSANKWWNDTGNKWWNDKGNKWWGNAGSDTDEGKVKPAPGDKDTGKDPGNTAPGVKDTGPSDPADIPNGSELHLGALGDGTKNLTVGSIYAGKDTHNLVNAGNGTHNFKFKGHITSANGGDTLIRTGSGTDNISIAGAVVAKDAKNTFNLGVDASGTKNVSINESVWAKVNGTNTFNLGDGTKNISISQSVLAETHSKNAFTLGDGKNNISIGQALQARSGGENEFMLKGTNNLSIGKGGMEAETDSANHIYLGAGTNNASIRGHMSSSGLNEIIGGADRDNILVSGSLVADHGTNRIATGAGHDNITIGGVIKTTNHGVNIIDAGAGNDTVTLHGNVGQGSLQVAGGDGYDTLVLHASDSNQFNLNFASWMTDYAKQGDLAGSSLEAVRIDISSRFGLDQVDWLTQLLNDHNTSHPGSKIDLELGLDGSGDTIRLGDIFTQADESAITGINLSGSHVNTLQIGGSLTESGYDGLTLKITGDSNDRVELDHSWQNAQFTTMDDAGLVYNVYTNTAAEELLVQSSLHVIYG